MDIDNRVVTAKGWWLQEVEESTEEINCDGKIK